MNSMYRSSQPEQGFSTKPNWTGGLWTALSLWGEYEHGTKAITWLLDSKNKIAHHQKATTKIDVCDGYFFKILKNWNRSLHLIWLKKNLWRSRKKESKSGKTGRWMGDGSKKKKKCWCEVWMQALCVCVWEGKRRREEVVLPLQQSVGSAFTVAEQSGRHSRPAGSTWHAISSAPGTLATQPAQPKHTSTGDQNNAKQTRDEHTDNMWEGGGRGKAAAPLCLLPVPRPARPYLQAEVERPFKFTLKFSSEKA